MVGTGLQALGAGLLSGNRYQPIGPGFSQTLALAQKGAPKEALKQILMQAGYSAEDAEKLSANEAVAKLAIDQKREQGFDSLVSGAFSGGGGGVSPAPRATPAAPAGPAAGASLNGGTTLTGDMGQYARAIQSNESGGRYDIVGPTHPKYGRALGAYQVMESNLPSWSQEALGRVVSPEEFLGSKEIQDAIFAKKFGQAVAKYGNPQDAASVWFTGRPAAEGGNSRDSLGTSGNAYVSKFNSALRGIQASAGGQAPTQVAAGPQVPGAPVSNATAPPSPDAPAPDAQPAGFVIPGQQAPASGPSVGPATQNAARIRLQNEVNNTLALIARTGMYGDRGKALAEALKLKIAPLQKFLEPTDIERTLAAAENASPEAARIIRNSIQDSRPAEIQTYEYSRNDPGFLEYQKQLAEAKRSQVNIDQRAEGKFEETLGSKSGERFNNYIAAGDTARGMLSDIAALRAASRNLGSLGASADARARFGPMLEAAGIKVDGLDDIQFYRNTIARLAPQMRQPGSGAQSDTELKGFERSIGLLSDSPRAREATLDSLEAAARNQMSAADIATQVAEKQISRSEAEKRIRALPDPMSAFREYRRQNPDPGAPQAQDGGQPQRQGQAPEQPKMPTGNQTERALFIRDSRANAAAAIARAPQAREMILRRLKEAGVSVDGL